MVAISNPLNASEARRYHESDYSNKEQAYYTHNQEITGQWQGLLAEKMGLTGAVAAQQFERLSEGQHPETGKALVQQKRVREEAGNSKTAEHRAGWDATFSAPKSVSLTAIVGEDMRVRLAHREAVTIALNAMERYVNARMGGNHPTQHTGQWAVAKFEHDSARPVGGYAAPQLHTHAVFFNVTETADGKTRALDPRSIYAAQSIGTSVYQAELTYRLARLGYEFETGKSGAPEIKGYGSEYLRFQSARSQQIQDHMERNEVNGKEAAKLAAKATREAKLALSPDEQRRMNVQVAAEFSHQERAVVAAAEANHNGMSSTAREEASAAQRAVTFAARKGFERESQVTEGILLRDALNRTVGKVRSADLRHEIERRVQSGELVPVLSNRTGYVARYTSAELIRLERANLEMIRAGQDQKTPVVHRNDLSRYADYYQHLNDNQRTAVAATLSSRDQITAIQGSAGTGKTTSLAALREIAEAQGFNAYGLAPTSRAAQQLAEAGIQNSTLQKHLARGEQPGSGEKRIYFLDESSLASTRQVHEFLIRLHPQDRVVLIGDVRQHQAVDAGTPFQLLQAGGMETAVLDKIVRQTETGLRATVEDLVKGRTDQAFERLESSGAIHEIRSAAERKKQLAESYRSRSGRVLVVAPDNPSRYELNYLIHQAMQSEGRVAAEEHPVTIRIARQDLTGADREWAAKYQMGDEIRYQKGSARLGIQTGEYATVTAIHGSRNELTIRRADGSEQTYDPQRLKGVTVYRNEDRAFSTGDRVQFTAPQKELAVTHGEGRSQRLSHGVTNREGGTITAINPAGEEMSIRLDSGGMVSVATNKKQHLDLGYAVTSHSSQGQTSDAVLVYVDNARTNPALINDRLFYVAISRARESAEIYTDSSAALKIALGRDVSKSSALSEAEIVRASRSSEQIGAEQTSIRLEQVTSRRELTLESLLHRYAERFVEAAELFAAVNTAPEMKQTAVRPIERAGPETQHGDLAMSAGSTVPSSFDLILPYLRPIEAFIKDADVSEIMVNGGTGRVFIERNGAIEPSSVAISERNLQVAVRNIARSLGGEISPEKPILDSRLPDGSRVAAVFPPCSVGGTTLTIRKFQTHRFTVAEMVRIGSITASMLEYLRHAILRRENILISGGTGTGKTTLLNALAGYIPSEERVVLIEDTSEIQIAQPNLVRFEARRERDGVDAVTIRDLLKATLRHRPDRILLGEVRGAEAFDLLQAFNTGHSGSLSTIHANSALQSLNRFTNCTLQSDVNLPYRAIRANIAESLHLLVHIERRHGKRFVASIARVHGFDADTDRYQIEVLHADGGME